MYEKQAMMTGEIIENRRVAPGNFQMTVRLPRSFPSPSPGQFVMIRRVQPEEPLLARPLSVFGFQRHKDNTNLQLLYRVIGRGTKSLSCSKPGDELSVLGPLGRGFTIPSGSNRSFSSREALVWPPWRFSSTVDSCPPELGRKFKRISCPEN